MLFKEEVSSGEPRLHRLIQGSHNDLRVNRALAATKMGPFFESVRVKI